MSRRFTALTALATAALLATTMGTAGAQTTATSCGNAPAGYNVIESNARFIIGTTGNDWICAGDGNNIIRAKGLNDIIFGGGGNDVIWAGFGNDVVYGNEGNDLIRAGSGKDVVWGGPGNDRVFAGNGPDTVRGGDGDDILTGGEGHDFMRGGAGTDKLIGNKGIDRLFGDGGNDIVQGGVGPDTINGGAGDDNLAGGDQNDVMGGGDGNDRMLGGNGEDNMVGGNGDDTLLGGGNPDVLRGSNGNDMLDGGNGLNIATGGADADICLNVDSPQTTCEIIDGIEIAAPPARVTVTFPAAGQVMISGDDWSPSTDIEVSRPLVASPGQQAPTDTVASDANGDFTVLVDAVDIDGRFVRVFDPVTFRIKDYVPVLDSFTYVPATKELVVTGTLGEAVEAFVYDANGTLIFVEQMSFDDSTSRTVDFREIDGTIGRLDISHSDPDGDKEIHKAYNAG